MDGAATSAAVSLSGVTKDFRGNVVLKNVDFDLRAGEVHALAGANGSGKSTLMKIVYGVHRPSGGVMMVNGSPVVLRSPRHALRMGIAAVPQELPLFPGMSVAENIVFGDFPRRAGLIRWRQLRRRASEVLAQVDPGGRIDPATLVGSLGLPGQQLVSIARALAQGATVLVFDEPTSALDSEATDQLFEVIRRLRSEQRAIAFISQRLDDIFAIAEHVSVIRDGEIVARLAVGEATTDGIAELIAGQGRLALRPPAPRGRPISAVGACSAPQPTAKAGTPVATVSPPVLTVEGLTISSRIRDVTMSVAEGEILGLTGLSGCGIDEVLQALFGRRRLLAGSVRMLGKDMTRWPTSRRVDAGVAYVSGDRRHEGLVRTQTVAFNMTLALNRHMGLAPVSHRRQQRQVEEVIAKLKVRPPDPAALISTLSGGNEQKVVVGRWLLAGAAFWILNDPTRGVDVHARHDIHHLIREQVAAGGAAIITSSDILELFEICDRIIVFSRGVMVAELDPAEASEHQVLALAGKTLPAEPCIPTRCATDRCASPAMEHAAQ